MKLEFVANVKDVKSRNLVSGDKSYQVVIEGKDSRIMALDKAKPYQDLTFKVNIDDQGKDLGKQI